MSKIISLKDTKDPSMLEEKEAKSMEGKNMKPEMKMIISCYRVCMVC